MHEGFTGGLPYGRTPKVVMDGSQVVSDSSRHTPTDRVRRVTT